MVTLPRRTALQWMGLLGLAPGLMSGCSGKKPDGANWGGNDDGSSEKLPQEADLAGLKVNESLVQRLNRFGWELLRSLPEGNQFISPASVGVCLAMLERGAEGTTRGEIRKVLHLAETPDLTDPGWKTLAQFLRAAKPSRQVQLANALFLQSGCKMGTEFQNELTTWFQVKAKELDFKTDSKGAAKSINDWVGKRSGNALGNLLGPDALSASTRLILVNLIQFKGEWEKGFDKSQTAPGPFELAPGQKKSAPFMYKRHGEFRVRQTDLARAIEFPCKGDDRSVHIALPKKRHGLADLFDPKMDLSWNQLLFDPGDYGAIEVSVPKFAMESNLELRVPLSQLGMPQTFDPASANFARMNAGEEPLFVQEVLHKTHFVMDEEGARAVAVASAEVKKSEPRMIGQPFVADQPFLVAITDQATQSILFLGRVNDPTKTPIEA